MNYEAFYKISYGLFIVSSKGGDNKMNGYISNSVFQVTAEPPRIAVTCNKENHTAGLIAQSQALTISVLGENASSGLIGLFGYKTGKNTDKFDHITYETGETGMPVVTEGSVAWFECQVTQTFDVGTHLIFIGEVVNGELLDPDQPPLTYKYYREVKKGIAPKNAPTYIDKSKLRPREDTAPGMQKYECQVCGHIYDPGLGDEPAGIPPGTSFNDLPDDWTCPVCGARKSDFLKMK